MNKMIFGILDDEPEAGLSLQNIFNKENIETVIFHNSQELFNYRNPNEIFALFLDINLGNNDINGLEVLNKFKLISPETSVIIVSGNSNIKTAVDALKSGAYDYVEKPVFLSIILKIINNIKEKYSMLSQKNLLLTGVLSAYPLIGNSPSINEIKALITRYAPLNEPVLITGESGTGKEAIAARLHYYSKSGPYNKINIASLQSNLIESELFGYKKGAFSGAVTDKTGIIESTEGGSLFLDEIGEMDKALQSKILRTVQENEILPVGSVQTKKVSVRYIFATNIDLNKGTSTGIFREDLYYRISALKIHLPPLHERKEDIPLIAEYFIKNFCIDNNIAIKQLSKGALELLHDLHFKGNVRELKNLIIRSLAGAGSGDFLTERDLKHEQTEINNNNLSTNIFIETKPINTMKKQLEKKYIETQILKFGGDMQVVSDNLGILLPNLYRKIRELNINT